MQLNSPSQVIHKQLNEMDELHCNLSVKEKESDSHKDKCTYLYMKLADKKKYISKQDKNINILQIEKRKLESGNQQSGKELKSLETTLNELEKQHQSDRNQYKTDIQYLKCNLSKSEHDNEKLKEDLKMSTSNLNESENMICKIKAEIKDTQQNMKFLTKHLHEIDKDLQKSNENIITLNANLKKSNKIIDENNSELYAYEKNIQDIKQSLINLCYHFSHYLPRLDYTEDIINYLDTNIKTIVQKKKKLKVKLSQSNEDSERTHTQKSNMKKQMTAFSKNIAEYMDMLVTIDNELDNYNPPRRFSLSPSDSRQGDENKEPSASQNGQLQEANKHSSSVSIPTQKSKREVPQFRITNSLANKRK